MRILDLFRAANNAYAAGKAFIAKVDFSTMLNILGRVIELEAAIREPGKGSQKLDRLLDWVGTAFPQTKPWLDEVQDFVDAAVRLFNAIGWFRK